MSGVSVVSGASSLPVRIDPADHDLAGRTWSAHRTRSNVYARDSRRRYMHRLILERVLGRTLLAGEEVDHINGDGLDNRRANLRLASHQQNSMNSGARVNSRSGRKGVIFTHNKSRPWRALIMVDGRCIHLGYFGTADEAAQAYNTACAKHHGRFARLNRTED